MPPPPSAFNNCLTIQQQVNYYCSLRTSKDALTLIDKLQTTTSQIHAESIHLLIHHGQRLLGGGKNRLQKLMTTIGQLPHLKQLSLSVLHTKRLPASAVAVLLRHAKQLECLHLEDVTFEGSPYELAEVLNCHPTLHSVELLRCYCRPVHVLLQGLASMSNLQELTLDGTILAQQRDADAMAALTSVCQSSSLQRLHLSDLSDTTMTEQLLVMMEALEDHPNDNSSILKKKKRNKPSLKELSLQVALHETLPFTVVRAMGRMLLTNTSLQKIVVPWTGGGEAWLPIVEALAFNTTLKEFRLQHDDTPLSSHYCLSHHFLERAAAVLRDNNTTLQYFWYDDWREIDLEVDLYMTTNALGRGHLVYSEAPEAKPTHDEWVEALISSRDHIHVTNYWLSMNPGLLQVAAATAAGQSPMLDD